MRLILDIPIPWSVFIKVHISINQNPLITGIIQLIALRIRVMADKNKFLTFSSNFGVLFIWNVRINNDVKSRKLRNSRLPSTSCFLWCDILCTCWRNMLMSIQHQQLPQFKKQIRHFNFFDFNILQIISRMVL